MLLLLDNYDSFTYNLVHYLAELGADVRVERNDALSVADVLALAPERIVISPGPGAPEDAGVCLALLEHFRDHPGTVIPTLGVCLGHQCLGQVLGARVARAPVPVHGKTSAVHHQNRGVFHGLPSPFEATRYHSLIVTRESVPDVLEITAETADHLVMGLQHRTLPLHGVQFHPESIASEHGHALLRTFLLGGHE